MKMHRAIRVKSNLSPNNPKLSLGLVSVLHYYLSSTLLYLLYICRHTNPKITLGSLHLTGAELFLVKDSTAFCTR